MARYAESCLRRKPFPSFDEAINICHRHDVALRNEESLQGGNEVNKVSAYKREKKNKRDSSYTRSHSEERMGKCNRCGGGPHPKEKCYATGKTCHGCGKKDHLKSVCKAKPKESKNNKAERGRSNDRKVVTSVFCGSVDAGTVNKSPFCPLETITINVSDNVTGKTKQISNVMPDSGAGANLMGVGHYKQLKGNPSKLRKQNDVLYGANGLTINTLGRDEFNIEYDGCSVSTTFVITDEYKGTLLNRLTCKKLGILHETFPAKISNAVSIIQTDVTHEMLLKEFSDVFDTGGKLKAMKGPPIHIELMENAKPFRVNGPRPIPIPLRADAKKLVFDHVDKGVLKEVTEPTDWVHPFTVVLKTDGSLRLCVDLRMLNMYVKRPHHPVRSPKDAVALIPPDSKYFTIFDAKSGYFQCELDEESQLLTTFITPWGRFKHLRATMGLSSAGDEFNRRTDAALTGIPNMEKVVDDIIIHGKDLNEHIANVKQVLQRCREAGITLNPKKFLFAQSEVKFAGYIVSDKGIMADPNKLKAITHFPKPANITDLRSFQGLVHQLAGFSKDVSEAMQPLRPLLSTKSEFYWTKDHDKAFAATKKALTSPPVLMTFDPARPTMLQTDAARTKGLGYVLMQEGPDGNWHLIEANSRFISDAQSRYAMVELELLAVAYAMTECHNYLFGLPHFELVVDHQPLVSILNKKTLDCIDNERIRRLKAATSRYTFSTKWRKGKDHRIPDALSRAPVREPSNEELAENDEVYSNFCLAQKTSILSIDADHEDGTDDSLADLMLEELRQAGKNDDEYRAIIMHLKSSSEIAPNGLKHLQKVIDEMSVDNGLVLFRQRLFIPKPKRKDIVKRLHAAHQGIDRTLRRARQTVYWPGITSDIKSTIDACQMCQRYRASQQKEPMERDVPPSRIFEEIAADFFEYENRHYLAITDRYSGWSEMFLIGKPPTSKDLISCLVEFFSSKGCPVKLCSDYADSPSDEDKPDAANTISQGLDLINFDDEHNMAQTHNRAPSEVKQRIIDMFSI